MTPNFENLRASIQGIIEKNNSVDETLQDICVFLQKTVKKYNWVGFYFRNGAKEELILRQFAGEPTNHTIIPFGKGICGQVAASNQNFVVPDVSAQDNYIACSFAVKSEIVIPIFVDSKNIGQIDIDSHSINAFTAGDENFLVTINQLLADKFGPQLVVT